MHFRLIHPTYPCFYETVLLYNFHSGIFVLGFSEGIYEQKAISYTKDEFETEADLQNWLESPEAYENILIARKWILENPTIKDFIPTHYAILEEPDTLAIHM